jgi:hypothetical protein
MAARAAVVLPVLFVLLLRRARRTRAQRLERLGSLDVVRRLVPAERPRLERVAGGATRHRGAACRHRDRGATVGIRAHDGPSTGVDLVLAVDASLSMLASDERRTVSSV